MNRSTAAGDSPSVAAVVTAMRERLDGLPTAAPAHRLFLSTYCRTTIAVGKAVQGGLFEDADWVERWDVAFADLYFAALDADLAGDPVTRPWRAAFDAPSSLLPLRHVLLGINAHINFDLPQALLAVISDDELTDREVVQRRRRDHERIDGVLSSRVAAEGDELAARTPRTVLDQVLMPLYRLCSRRFLQEAREKVWHNAMELQRARHAGPAAYAERLGELEVLSAAKIADLLAPGPVLLRLAVGGFGVLLPPPRS